MWVIIDISCVISSEKDLSAVRHGQQHQHALHMCIVETILSSIPIHCLTGGKGNDSFALPQLFQPKAENKPLHLKVTVLILFGVFSQNIIK